MKTWRQAVHDGTRAGTLASLLSTAVLVVSGQREAGSPFAPTNAISHWLWGDHAARHDEANKRHTLTGYAIHHGASTLWGILYEKFFGDLLHEKRIAPAIAGAAAVAGMACFADYQLTPKRLRPGYEKRLSRSSLLWVYAAVGSGFLISSILDTKK
ncbi:MAG: hypothetical protein ACO1NO_07985 [Burkholderiaceae bacterium]